MNMSCVCLVVLIGLPAVGKTTACRYLMQLESLSFNIIHLCYDNLINFNSESQAEYKEQRGNILKLLKEIIYELKHFKCLPKKLQTMKIPFKIHQVNDIVILCDDNHYYRSMRYKLFQLAREQGIGYSQIYFSCDTKLALERNCSRSDSIKVPNDIILRMSDRLEVPNNTYYQWERNTLIVSTPNYNEIISFISQFLDKPVQPLQVSFSKSAAHQSKVHDLDLLMRKRIKTLISNKHEQKLLAKILNDKRKETLELFRRDICKRLFDDLDLNKYVDLLDNV